MYTHVNKQMNRSVYTYIYIHRHKPVHIHMCVHVYVYVPVKYTCILYVRLGGGVYIKHTHVQTCIHTCLRICYVCTASVCKYLCVCMYVCTYVCTCVVCAQVCMLVHGMYGCMHVCMCMCMYIYMCIYVYVYVYLYTYTFILASLAVWDRPSRHVQQLRDSNNWTTHPCGCWHAIISRSRNSNSCQKLNLTPSNLCLSALLKYRRDVKTPSLQQLQGFQRGH